MNYDEFKNYVMEHLSEWFPDEEYDVSLRKVVKNNGVVLDGLCIFSNGEKPLPLYTWKDIMRSIAPVILWLRFYL